MRCHDGCFNSRTPCGVRLSKYVTKQFRNVFQFTHPVWGATQMVQTIVGAMLGFNSRTPCGVRHDTSSALVSAVLFQFTHPVWGATGETYPFLVDAKFQFTHPVWGAT